LAKHHFQVSHLYRPDGEDLPILVNLVVAQENPDPEIMAKSWRDLLGNQLYLHVNSGDHFTMMWQPSVAKLADCIRKIVGLL
jgi:thioesterase domain-containing protein